MTYRCTHPAQQHGRRFPRVRFSHIIFILRSLVSDFLADSIQHIHSLRASGVISSHTVCTTKLLVRIFCKSAGNLCTTPPEISLLVICLFYQILWIIKKAPDQGALNCLKIKLNYLKSLTLGSFDLKYSFKSAFASQLSISIVGLELSRSENQNPPDIYSRGCHFKYSLPYEVL